MGAQDRRDKTDAVALLQADARRAESTMRLYASLIAEQEASQAAAVAHQYRLSLADASRLVGFDIVGHLAQARAGYNTAVQATGPVLGDSVSALVSVRARVDAGTVTDSEVRAAFGAVIAAARVAWQAELAPLGRLALDAPGAARMLGAVNGMGSTVDAFAAAADETSAAATFSLGMSDNTKTRQDLAAAHARYVLETSQFSVELSDAAQRAWRAVQASPESGQFESFVESLLDQPGQQPPSPADLPRLSSVFHSAFVRQDSMRVIVDAAAADITGLAQQLHDAAQEDLRNYLAALTIISVLSVAIAMVTARGIVRPLNRLADRAGELSNGIVDGAPLPSHGPREVALVSEALNETVANLRAVDAAAVALAEADFENPVLHASVQGQIGVSLRKSVRRLSQSVRDNEDLRRSLESSEARYRELSEHSPDVIWRLSRRPVPHFDYLSPSFETLTGIPAVAALADLNVFLDALEPEGRAELTEAFIGRSLAPVFDVRLHRPDGSLAIFEVRLAANISGLQGVARDVTEIRALQARVADQALRDPLTGLANRRLLDEILAGVFLRTDTEEQPVAAAFLDLDGFKSVNDHYGHDAGDVVLQETARRLLGTVREADVVARVGGDEFVILFRPTSVGSDSLVERIDAALGVPIDLGDGVWVQCRPSIGVADTREVGRDSGALLAEADSAMYQAKRNRARGTRILYHPSVTAVAAED